MPAPFGRLLFQQPNEESSLRLTECDFAQRWAPWFVCLINKLIFATGLLGAEQQYGSHGVQTQHSAGADPPSSLRLQCQVCSAAFRVLPSEPGLLAAVGTAPSTKDRKFWLRGWMSETMNSQSAVIIPHD
jgi:hypothetical protein